MAASSGLVMDELTMLGADRMLFGRTMKQLEGLPSSRKYSGGKRKRQQRAARATADHLRLKSAPLSQNVKSDRANTRKSRGMLTWGNLEWKSQSRGENGRLLGGVRQPMPAHGAARFVDDDGCSHLVLANHPGPAPMGQGDVIALIRVSKHSIQRISILPDVVPVLNESTAHLLHEAVPKVDGSI